MSRPPLNSIVRRGGLAGHNSKGGKMIKAGTRVEYDGKKGTVQGQGIDPRTGREKVSNLVIVDFDDGESSLVAINLLKEITN